MRQRYLNGLVRIQRDTEQAVLLSFDWSDDHGYVAVDAWVPLSVVHEDDLYKIEDACEGDIIEIALAEWFLKKHF